MHADGRPVMHMPQPYALAWTPKTVWTDLVVPELARVPFRFTSVDVQVLWTISSTAAVGISSCSEGAFYKRTRGSKLAAMGAHATQPCQH